MFSLLICWRVIEVNGVMNGLDLVLPSVGNRSAVPRQRCERHV